MANIVNGKYGLVEPGDGITAISMEGGEINLFGNSFTLIKTSAIDLFPQVKDIHLESKEPVEEKEENFTENEVLTAYVVTGLLAGLAIGGVLLAPATGGASLWMTFSAGTAAFGSGLNANEMKKKSSEIEEDTAADALLTGSATTSVLAGIAIVGVLLAPVTGGTSLGLTVVSGTAAAGTGLTTSGMVRNSRETGYQPNSTEIAENLIMGGCVGAMTGAFILDVIAAVPAFAVAVGVTAGMSLGTSTLTTSVIPPIVKMAGYGTAALNVLFTANEIYSSNAGHNEVLEKVFKDNTSAYEGVGEILALICMGIITTGTANRGLVTKKEKKGVIIEKRYKAPDIKVNSKGELTNGQYTLNQKDMQIHLDGKNSAKSQFLHNVDAYKAVLDAAAYADENNLWQSSSGNLADFENKAKVYVENGPVGVTGKGELTNYINVYRTKTGYVHGCPGNP